MQTIVTTNSAYQSCLDLAASHYENFPVASRLLPDWMRPPVAAIYAFARHADDFADEGNLNDDERLALLDNYRQQLGNIEKGQDVNDPVFVALKHAIYTHNLPLNPFYKLLSAFTQDVTKKRYTNIDEVLDYCDNSANPVGYLLLCLFKRATENNVAYSNSICSALQIINFLQDISVDYQKGRIYLPQDEMQKFGVTESQIAKSRYSPEWRRFMETQLQRVETMMRTGAPLATILPGRVGYEIRATIMGGMTVIRKLKKQNMTKFNAQPRLHMLDWVKILAGTLYYPYS